MKTPSKILVSLLFGSALGVAAFAGPGAQYWQNRGVAAKSPAVQPSDASSGMNCSTMLDTKMRVSRETSTTGVTPCTPETLKTSARCQQACGT